MVGTTTFVPFLFHVISVKILIFQWYITIFMIPKFCDFFKQQKSLNTELFRSFRRIFMLNIYMYMLTLKIFYSFSYTLSPSLHLAFSIFNLIHARNESSVNSWSVTFDSYAFILYTNNSIIKKNLEPRLYSCDTIPISDRIWQNIMN